MPKTMFEKIWETHEVHGPEQEGGPSLLYIGQRAGGSRE